MLKMDLLLLIKVTQEKNDKKGFQKYLILDIKMNLGFAPRFASLDKWILEFGDDGMCFRTLELYLFVLI